MDAEKTYGPYVVLNFICQRPPIVGFFALANDETICLTGKRLGGTLSKLPACTLALQDLAVIRSPMDGWVWCHEKRDWGRQVDEVPPDRTMTFILHKNCQDHSSVCRGMMPHITGDQWKLILGRTWPTIPCGPKCECRSEKVTWCTCWHPSPPP